MGQRKSLRRGGETRQEFAGDVEGLVTEEFACKDEETEQSLTGAERWLAGLFKYSTVL